MVHGHTPVTKPGDMEIFRQDHWFSDKIDMLKVGRNEPYSHMCYMIF